MSDTTERIHNNHNYVWVLLFVVVVYFATTAASGVFSFVLTWRNLINFTSNIYQISIYRI